MDFLKTATAQRLLSSNNPMIKQAINLHALKEAERLVKEANLEHLKFSEAKKKVLEELTGESEKYHEKEAAQECKYAEAKTFVDNFIKQALADNMPIDPMLSEIPVYPQFENGEVTDAGVLENMWQTVKENPVKTTLGGLGLLAGVYDIGGRYAANKQFFDPEAFMPQAKPDTWLSKMNLFSVPSADQEVLSRDIRMARQKVVSEAAGESRKITAETANTLFKAQDAAKKALAEARALGHGKVLAGTAALGIGTLGLADWLRGDKSILQEYTGSREASVNMQEDRPEEAPFVNPYLGAGVGALTGMGLYTLANAALKGDTPSAGKLVASGLAGMTLGGVGMNVYNNLTTDYSKVSEPTEFATVR